MKKYIFAIIFTLLLCRTWVEVPAYENMDTLMTSNIKNFPRSPQAHLNMGAIYQANKEVEKAELEYRRAVTLDPEFALAYHNLGKLYLVKNGDVGRALIDKAHDLLPNDPFIGETWKKQVKGLKIYKNIIVPIEKEDYSGIRNFKKMILHKHTGTFILQTIKYLLWIGGLYFVVLLYVGIIGNNYEVKEMSINEEEWIEHP